ncbi:coiled-coil domain-containing protein 24 [Labrus bergylta]|uniref:coiled-coil domain-containing protein 24 n=1 Tax=Labrus bergylta TaxID=56723 RepID=UPI0033135485
MKNAICIQSPYGNQLWCPSQSLWSLITDHVPGSELLKVCTALGHSLVDMYKDVHIEAEMWYKMWQESHQGNIGSRAGTPLQHPRGSFLPDPPAVKELLRAEVKMLLQTLSERAGKEGIDDEELLFRYKPETVDYALGHLNSCQTLCIDSADSDCGSRPSSHCSVRSSAADEVQSMRDKLNVTDIDQVVDRLRSVLMEECGELKRLVKYLKGNIKQKCRSQLEKPEPTLAELRELRGAVQMDLELFPTSLTVSPSRSSPLPLKGLKNTSRLTAGQKVSDETPLDLGSRASLRPHPPPLQCQTKPKPPLRASSSKTSASVKVINSPSPSRTQGQLKSTLASSGRRKIQIPICTRISTSGHVDSHSNTSLPGPGRNQIMDQTRCDDHSVSLFTSSPGLHIETSKNSPIPDTHQSSHYRIHSTSLECDSSPHRERRSPSWRSNCTDHSVPTTGSTKTKNKGQTKTCGGGIVSATVKTSNIHSSNCHPQTGPRESNNSMDRNRNGVLRGDTTRPGPKQLNKQYFTSHKIPPEGTTSQQKKVQEAKRELEFIGKLHQPVPPPRVPT